MRATASFALVLLTLLCVVSQSGCTRLPLYGSAALPLDVEGKLEGQLVVVQCISPRDSYEEFRPGPALSRRIAEQLRREDAKVIIDSSNRLRDEEKPGAALLKHHHADVALLIQFDDFRLHDESDAYRGRTAYKLQVYKASKPSVAILEQSVAGYAYPEDGPVDARRTSQANFRSDFLQDLAEQISASVK